MPKLIDVSHVSKRGTSLRITLPKAISSKLGANSNDIIAFYDEDGKIIIRKLE